MGVFINNNSLLEVYLGKSKQFEEVEKEFKKLIQKVLTEKNNDIIDDSQENKNIESILTDFFKVKRIKIHWTDKNINACTLPASHPLINLNILKNFKETKNFISKNLSIYIIMDKNLITIPKLNEKELMALLLHEIGHNFDYTPFYFLQAFPLLYIPFIDKIFKSGFNLKNKIDNVIQEKLPFIYKLLTFKGKLISKLGLGNIIVTITSPMLILKKLTSNILMYGRERFADSFAATYGYAEHLASSIRKITDGTGTLVNTVENVLIDFLKVSSTISKSFIDPHPTTKTRITNLLDKLKKDLNDPDLPKELKEDLNSNIKYFENYIEKYDEILKNDKDRIFSYTIEKIANKFFGGKTDFREILNFIYKKTEI